MAQWLHTARQAFLGAETVCRVVPYSSQAVQSPDLSSFYSQDSRPAWKQDKAVGQIFKFSLCKVPNEASAVSAESLLCPVRKRHGIPHRPLPGHFTWPRCSCQHCGTAATLHEPTLEEFLWMKALQTAQGFYDIPSWPLLTSSLGCCFLLAHNCQCVLSRAISNQCLRYIQHFN